METTTETVTNGAGIAPVAREVAIDAKLLRDGLRIVQAHMSGDLTRPHLAQVLIELTPSGLVRLVSTDGHRLARVTIDTKDGFDAVPLLRCSVDPGALKQLISTLSGAKYAATLLVPANGGKLELAVVAGGSIAVPCRDGADFPPYDKVIPSETASGRDQIGTSFMIGLNPSYLADAGKVLTLISGRGKNPTGVKLRFTSDRDPVRIDCESSDGIAATIVIMPMRV